MSRNIPSGLVPIAAITAATSAVLLYSQWVRTKKGLETIQCFDKNEDDDSDDNQNIAPPIYLDYNGTTPIQPEVTKAMLPYFTQHFGNPSSTHYYGKGPKKAIQKARASVASLVGGSQDGVIFTGCGTEADNLAIHLALQSHAAISNKEKIPHVISTCVEHPAILEYLKNLQQQQNIKVTFLPVSSECQVSTKDLEAAIIPNQTCLVSVMMAQNEIGALQPISKIMEICERHGVLFHTDAAQAIGKINLHAYFQSANSVPDMITIVGHKFGAPKGIAALYIHPTNTNAKNMLSTLSDPASPSMWGKSGGLLIGGGQESGRRAGTENVPYIVGLGKAAELVKHQFQNHPNHLEYLRNCLLQQLTKCIYNSDHDVKNPNNQDLFCVNGPKDPAQRLPNTLSISIRNIRAGPLLQKLGKKDVAASAGSACHSSDSVSISSVLKEMTVPMDYAMGTLRLSVGSGTTEQEVKMAAERIANEIHIQWKDNAKIMPCYQSK